MEPTSGLFGLQGVQNNPSAIGAAGILQTVTSDITLAVTTAGVDVSPSRPSVITGGNWSAFPFLTIQAAINSVPFYAPAPRTVSITVGPGSFAGFAIVQRMSGITVTGTKATFVPATGPSVGTLTAFSGRLATLAGAGWTVDDLVGKFFRVTAGTGVNGIFMIAANAADTITFASHPATPLDATSVFVIEDITTQITSAASGFAGTAIHVCPITSNGLTSAQVDTFKITAAGLTYGVRAMRGSSLNVRRVLVQCNATYGLTVNEMATVLIQEFGAIGCGRAIDCYGRIAGTTGGIFSMGSTGAVAFNFSQCWVVGFDGNGSAYARGCAGMAIEVLSCQYFLIRNIFVDGATIGCEVIDSHASFNGSLNNCSTAAFRIRRSYLELIGIVAGAGNIGFGLNAYGAGNVVEVLASNTITGTLGDCSVDGAVATTWASMPAAGDYVADLASGARIFRSA